MGPLRAVASIACFSAVARGGDLLRPGGTSGSSSSSSSTASSEATAATAPVNLDAQDVLRRSTAALQAVKSMQAAARAAALGATGSLGVNPNNPTITLPIVPDASATTIVPASNAAVIGPGLHVLVNAQGTPTLWQGASLPVATVSTPNTVTITQSQQQAFLAWQTFDIGKNTSLVYNQSAGGASVSDWIAFNYIRDPSGRPSQILGSITTVGPESNGQATPGGQVYVLNANGIIFGGSSQVNAYALVASSLPLNTNLVQSGLLDNPDDQFLFSATALASGSKGPTPEFDPSAATSGVAPAQTPFLADGSGNTGATYGDVVVEAGATITAPSTSANVGGRVALIAPNVTNDGTISTPDGQTILAAGLQVGVAAHSSSDAKLRGLDVYIGSVGDEDPNQTLTAGTATNAAAGAALSVGGTAPAAGLIEAPRADVTVAGATVNQMGAIDSSTSVSYNGQIDLLAAYDSVSSGGNSSAPFFPQKTGAVTLGSASLTQILPELGSSATVAATSLSLPSTVLMQGSSITLEGSDGSTAGTGAILLAPSGNVTLDAGSWQFTSGGIDPTGTPVNGSAETFIFDSGQISLADGAAIDASGSENVSASVQENIVAVQLLGPQLADSPLQRNGPLRGQTIYVDVRDNGVFDGTPWVGTPLADTSGYVSLIPHTVGELTTAGGNVALNAGSSVSLATGSSVDVAGGWTNYQGGMVATTKLLYQGQVVDISQASPDVVYSGIYTGTSTTTNSKWGTSTTISNPLPIETYDPGYVQGGGGGSLSITAAAMALGGTLFGQTYAGANQLKPLSTAYSSASLGNVTAAGIDPTVWKLGNQPAYATLSLSFEQQYAVGSGTYDFYSPAPPDIFFVSPSGAAGGGSTTTTTTTTNVYQPPRLVLSPNLTDPGATIYGGFGNLVIDDSADNYQVTASGKLTIPVDPFTGLQTVKFGSITVGPNLLDPNNVAIVTAPGGSITLSAGNVALQGGIDVPGGTVSITGNDFWENSPFFLSGAAQFEAPAYDPDRGNVDVGADVLVSTSGLIVDSRFNPREGLNTAGGTISLLASNLTIEPGAVIAVNGGGQIGAKGAVIYGNAGSITLNAGEDPAPGLATNPILGGTLKFDPNVEIYSAADAAPLQGYSGATGGKLSLTAPLVQVGTNPAAVPQVGTLVLTSSLAADGTFQSFFNDGGFANFDISGIGRAETDANGNDLVDAKGNVLFYPAVLIASGTTAAPTLVEPRVEQVQITATATGFAASILAPPSYLNTPVSLAFNALGATDTSESKANLASLVVRGDLVLANGAIIETDPQTNGGGISLTGNTVAVLGSVISPGGTITVTGGGNSLALFEGLEGIPTVDLGPYSYLDAAGTTVLAPDINGRVYGQSGYINTGTVLNGGNVSVTGNIVAEGPVVGDAAGSSAPGAKINVSGWSDTADTWGLLQEAPALSGGGAPSGMAMTYLPTAVASNGGSISLTGKQSLFPDATLVGQAGGPTATGGTLAVTGLNSGTLYTTLQVTATGPTIPAPFYPTGETAIGNTVLDSSGNPVTGLALGNFAASSFTAGGFDSLVLHGTIYFLGDLSIAAKGRLVVGDSGIVSATGLVSLSGSEVSIGQPYTAPTLAEDTPYPLEDTNAQRVAYPATPGGGAIFVTAGSAGNPGLIDVGNLTLQNISTAQFTTAGDVRGFGTFDIAGQATFTAGAVYPVTSETFAINAYDSVSNGTTLSGMVTFNLPNGAAARPVPLSAGGTLSVYATDINQNGVLEAPAGTINLGWNGTGTAPVDAISEAAVEPTTTLNIGTGSMTVVSAASAGTTSGAGLPIPYGINLNGTSWIDPTGADITSSGPASKAVTLAGATVNVAPGATINVSGGGDLYAYQFIPGTGGTNDILSAASASFAVVPSYAANYAPDAAFNANAVGRVSLAQNLLYPDDGYSSGSLQLGEQIHIDLGNGAGPQNYTLLPARYALLPGAYLITAVSTPAYPSAAASVQPDGSTVALGYAYSAFDPSRPLYREFQVTPEAVVRTRADYGDTSANTFFTQNAAASGQVAPLLPLDGGQLVLTAGSALTLLGTVDALAATGGRGGSVDISSQEDIVINTTGQAASGAAGTGTLYLSATELTGADAGTLVIGGSITENSTGEVLNVATPNLTVDNAGSPLEASDIVLVANQGIIVAPNAQIEAAGTLVGGAPSLQISDPISLEPALTVSAAGSAAQLNVSRGGAPILLPQGVPTGDAVTASVAGTYTLPTGKVIAFAAGTPLSNLAAGTALSLGAAGTLTATGAGKAVAITSGDGVLVRVSSDPAAATSRTSVLGSTAPSLEIGSNASLKGASVTVDSTNQTRIDPTVALSGAVALSSGQISLLLDGTVPASAVPNTFVLTPTALADLQTSATALSLLSYSSIDTYGAGTVGSSGFSSLGLHAAEIRAFQAASGGTGVMAGSSGTVLFLAQTISLDNSPDGAAPGRLAGAVASGTLELQGKVINLGADPLAIDQFSAVSLTATNDLLFKGSGSVAVGGDVALSTPLMVGANGASQAIIASGDLVLSTPGGSAAAVTPGVGATLALKGATVEVGNDIELPSGSLAIEATGVTGGPGNVTVGGTLDVRGTEKTFNSVPGYSDAGTISLSADLGDIIVAAGGSLNLSAEAAGGNAGSLAVSAPAGRFIVAATDLPAPNANGTLVPTLLAAGPTTGIGQGGTFSLDALALADASDNPTTSLSALESLLQLGGFSQSQSFRLRSGNVLVDGPVVARTFDLSADQGDIEVTSAGSINASGPTGGTIELDAGGSVTLDGGSSLSVAGVNFNDAGQGGSVTLQAGAFTSSGTGIPTDARDPVSGLFDGGPSVNIAANSSIDLSVANTHVLQLNPGGSAAATPAGTITVPSGVDLYFPSGTPGNDTVAFTSSGTITGPGGVATSFVATARQPYVASLASGSSVVLTSGGTVSFAAGSGGSIPVGLPYTAGGSTLGLAAVNTTELGAYYSTGSLTLVAPQVFDSMGNPIDVRVDPIAGAITGASSVVVEGLNVINLTPSTPGAATIDATTQALVQANGTAFAGGIVYNPDGTTSTVAGNTAAIIGSLTAGNFALAPLVHVRPAEEIVNTGGDLDLTTTWDFAQGAVYSGSGDPALAANWASLAMPFRFGPNNTEPGALILRASGNVSIGVDPVNGTFGSLNDEFAGFDGADNSTLMTAVMLPAGYQSWSFRLVSGADFTAADTTRTLSANALATAGTAGSIQLGSGSADLPTIVQSDPSEYYQTIRTGTGSIGLYAGGDVQLVNNLFSVYTAGTLTAPLDTFDVPVDTAYPAQFPSGGGNVTVVAQGSIAHLNAEGLPDSSKELPLNWLASQGALSPATGDFTSSLLGVDSTAWWTNFGNYFEGIATLGGGNVSLAAGGNISNVDAAVATNERTGKQTDVAVTGTASPDLLAADQATLELGGGDLRLAAGGDIDGGVYYVERGQGTLRALGSIHTNATRSALDQQQIQQFPLQAANPLAWLPTTLFLGDGGFDVEARGSVLLGPVLNPFLLPQSASSGSVDFFSTYGVDAVVVTSLTGSVTLRDSPDGDGGVGGGGSISDWLALISAGDSGLPTTAEVAQPWLSLNVPQVSQLTTLSAVMPSSLAATAFNGDINLVGGFSLLPAADGQVALEASGSVNGIQPNKVVIAGSANGTVDWASSSIDLSDADPARIPGLASPATSVTALDQLNALFAESGSVTGTYAVLQTQQTLHDPSILHGGDPDPLTIDAGAGSISGITLYSPKQARIFAGQDITDTAFYIQNDAAGDITTIAAGGSIVPYDPSSPLRLLAEATGNALLPGGSVAAGPRSGNPTAGDIQVAGPGTLEVLAGGSINLGETAGVAPTDGTSVGVTTIGNAANPSLPFQGADIVMAAGITGLGGLGSSLPGLSNSAADFSSFIAQYLDPATAPSNAARYLPEVASMLGVTISTGETAEQIWSALLQPPSSEPAETEDLVALDGFNLVLRDAGRDHNDVTSPSFGTYNTGYAAIAALFPGYATTAGVASNPASGDITLATRLVETKNGGNIDLLTPGGGVTVGRPSDPQGPDQGVITEQGGDISIFAQDSVEVGTSRIFTLFGGDEVIWSSLGDIAAGSGSKTVHSAPPTRVLVDPQSATVENDLAGLATGSGIGVLATLTGVAAGSVDLIAPVGTVDAGDAGIRASGSINISALHVVNANNIQAGGTTTGVPVVAAPNIGGLTSASSSTAAASSTASQVAAQQQSSSQATSTEIPSVIDVEVVGYGGGDDFPS